MIDMYLNVRKGLVLGGCWSLSVWAVVVCGCVLAARKHCHSPGGPLGLTRPFSLSAIQFRDELACIGLSHHQLPKYRRFLVGSVERAYMPLGTAIISLHDVALCQFERNLVGIHPARLVHRGSPDR
jgi:hypothetical protein